ncbi:MAG: response regulator transcription factor [bacterium]
MKRKIWAVDDDHDIREIVRKTLTDEGFHVDTMDSGAQLLTRLAAESPDLVVLDVMMPGENGIDICRDLRRFSEVPVVFLSSHRTDIDKIIALELGADDYIGKPFNPRELVARIKAVLRRIEPQDTQRPEEIIERGGLKLDITRHRAYWNDNLVDLTKTEFEIVGALLRNPTRVQSRETLMRAAYDVGIHVSARTIDSHIRRLRSKFAELGGDPVETVRGIGYTLNPDV